MGTGGGGISTKTTAGMWGWPLTSIHCRDYEWVDVYLHSSIYAFMTYVGKTTLFRTKHVDDRSSFVQKPAGFISLSRRSDRFINCIAVIPRVSRRNDRDDIWTNPGLCFHMDLCKSLSTSSLLWVSFVYVHIINGMSKIMKNQWTLQSYHLSILCKFIARRWMFIARRWMFISNSYDVHAKFKLQRSDL